MVRAGCWEEAAGLMRYSKWNYKLLLLTPKTSRWGGEGKVLWQTISVQC